MSARVSVIGSDIRAAQCALTLAELGIKVSLLVPTDCLEMDSANNQSLPSHQLLHLWPLLLKVASHPNVRLHSGSHLKSFSRQDGKFSLIVHKKARYIKEDLCTGCGKCEEVCSIRFQTFRSGRKTGLTAIHAPIPGAKTVPSAYLIEKEGISPCHAGCPLGINVPGFIALLAKGKIDKARALINEAAPMAGVLGRLCTRPCESNCSRSRLDRPVFIQALHRYVADNSSRGIPFTYKVPAASRPENIAVIGSGPAGLTAAWELARRGYTPTVFESHAAIGGMLATGIPRFRLPHEVRERAVEAIRAMGVTFKAGVTIGRDITCKDLVDRGYKAFFLAIGAGSNSRLNIPGENLKGVQDCLSLLFGLNLKMGTPVGNDVVVIGSGNCAVGAARSIKRESNGNVRILCSTPEMTAVRDEVEEALKEGIPIEYNVSVLEILGEDSRVSGVRCCKVSKTLIGPDGRIQAECLPGSEFHLEADQVVIAVLQTPDPAVLNISNLAVNQGSRIIADPVTLETSVKGMFAGGDAVTGPGDVVSAMAAGLRAADSIDKYLRGEVLQRDPVIPDESSVEINLEKRKASPDKRAKMPELPVEKRKGNWEETDLGLPEPVAKKEAARCLNCAICCECRECELACEVKAVNLDEKDRDFLVECESIINCGPGSLGESGKTEERLYEISGQTDYENVAVELARSAATALTAAMDLNLNLSGVREKLPVLLVDNLDQRQHASSAEKKRIGVFLCRCGDSISSIIDFNRLSHAVSELPDICSIHSITQSCTGEGSRKIGEYLQKENINRIVLAGCRCCNLEQVCLSCTDRRVMCQHNLALSVARPAMIEYANIREQCAWIHSDDPLKATEKAFSIISSAVGRVRVLESAAVSLRSVIDTVLIVGADLPSLAATEVLALQGLKVHLVFSRNILQSEKLSPDLSHTMRALLQNIQRDGVNISPWPLSMKLNGAPGNFEFIARYKDNSEDFTVHCGAVILDLLTCEKETAIAFSESNLINRVIARQHYSSRVSTLDTAIAHSYTVRETAGIFIAVPVGNPTAEDQMATGRFIASRASIYLGQQTFRPRSASVTIDTGLCRGCGNCTGICPYIELTDRNGVLSAFIDPALCFGCGACVIVCPTGAIRQPLQSEEGILATLEGALQTTNLDEVG